MNPKTLNNVSTPWLSNSYMLFKLTQVTRISNIEPKLYQGAFFSQKIMKNSKKSSPGSTNDPKSQPKMKMSQIPSTELLQIYVGTF